MITRLKCVQNSLNIVVILALGHEFFSAKSSSKECKP